MVRVLRKEESKKLDAIMNKRNDLSGRSLSVFRALNTPSLAETRTPIRYPTTKVQLHHTLSSSLIGDFMCYC